MFAEANDLPKAEENMTVATPSAKQLTTIKRRSPFAETWDNLRRSWGGMIGLSLIIFHLLLALTSPYLIPRDPFVMNAQTRNEAPSTEHLMGTDKLGRDIFSRSMLNTSFSL